MQTLVAEILAAWRRAERLSNELPEGSPEQAAAQAVADKMRDVYQELTQMGAAHEVTEAEARMLLEELAT
jgi:type IV pilus biogenesis protein CpaD/CtpE